MPNVLIIDDDDSVSRLLKTHLTDEGYNVSVVDHAEDGLALALKEPPDLIMLDVFLPDATGFQICSQFRKNAATKTTPIIMMTGAARFPSQQAFGRQRGANEYIFKPFKVIEVGELVHKYIGSKRTTVPQPKVILEAPLPERKPEMETPAQMLGEPKEAVKTNGHSNSSSNMQALSQFLKQALKKQSTDEAAAENTIVEDQMMNHLQIQITEPVEPLSVPVLPLSLVEALTPMAPLVPMVPVAPVEFVQTPRQDSKDSLIEMSSLASRLSWLTMARKMNVLDAAGQTELENTCKTLITLLTDFQNREKIR